MFHHSEILSLLKLVLALMAGAGFPASPRSRTQVAGITVGAFGDTRALGITAAGNPLTRGFADCSPPNVVLHSP